MHNDIYVERDMSDVCSFKGVYIEEHLLSNC